MVLFQPIGPGPTGRVVSVFDITEAFEDLDAWVRTLLSQPLSNTKRGRFGVVCIVVKPALTGPKIVETLPLSPVPSPTSLSVGPGDRSVLTLLLHRGLGRHLLLFWWQRNLAQLLVA